MAQVVYIADGTATIEGEPIREQVTLHGVRYLFTDRACWVVDDDGPAPVFHYETGADGPEQA